MSISQDWKLARRIPVRRSSSIRTLNCARVVLLMGLIIDISSESGSGNRAVWLESVYHDLRFGTRELAKSKRRLSVRRWSGSARFLAMRAGRLDPVAALRD